MAIGVLILGESGSGKSYSMRNFKEDEVKVISVEKPILPFKNHLELVRTSNDDEIIAEMKSTEKKSIVIDDFQYILGLAAMRRSLEKGWDKFSEMQYDYFKVLDALKELPDDVIVYFMSHTETTEDGVTKIKTIGKALDKYITIEGLFMIVLGTRVSDGQYYFITQSNGKDTLKTPAGMFPSYAVDNDLKYVDEKIRNYYELGEFLTDDEMAKIDDSAKKDIHADDEKPGRGRRSTKKEEAAQSGTDANEQSPANAGSETTKKRTRKSREEVKAENTEKIVNAGLEEAGDAEEVPYEDVEDPELEPLPRHTRKKRTEEETVEEAPARRRRRRV